MNPLDIHRAAIELAAQAQRDLVARALRRNLRGIDLSTTDLSKLDLSCANLSNANLRGADLSKADLTKADLRGADLTGADFTGTDLRGANLTRTIGLTADQRAVFMKQGAIVNELGRDDVRYVGSRRCPHRLCRRGCGCSLLDRPSRRQRPRPSRLTADARHKPTHLPWVGFRLPEFGRRLPRSGRQNRGLLAMSDVRH